MICTLCERSSPDASLFEGHHYEPIKTRRKSEETMLVCHQCGDQIHLLFSNTALRMIGSDLKLLLLDEKLRKYIAWVKDKPLETRYTMKEKKRKR